MQIEEREKAVPRKVPIQKPKSLSEKQEKNLEALVKFSSESISSHIRLQDDAFLSYNVHYASPLQELTAFLVKAINQDIPVRYKVIGDSRIEGMTHFFYSFNLRPHVQGHSFLSLGGFTYVFKFITLADKHQQQSFSGQTSWRMDGLKFDFNEKLQSNLEVGQSDNAIIHREISRDQNTGFTREAAWISFRPDLVVIQYRGLLLRSSADSRQKLTGDM